MELKIEYSNNSLTSEKLEALVVFVVEDSDLRQKIEAAGWCQHSFY